MTDDVQVQFGAQIAGLLAGINKATENLEGLRGQVSSITDSFGDLGKILVTVFAVDKIADYIKHMGELAEATQNAAAILGVTTDALQEFQYAMQQTTGNGDAAAQVFSRMQNNMAEAASKAGDMRDAFNRAGVSMEELQTRDFLTNLKDIANTYSRTADGMNKTNNAIDIGGRGFAKMIPLLNQGEKGIALMIARYDELGAKMTGEQLAAFDENGDKLNDLGYAMRGLGNTIYEAIAPAVAVFLDRLTSMISGINDSIKAGGEWHAVLELIGAALTAVAVAVDTFVTGIGTVYRAVVLYVGQIIIMFETLSEVMMKALTGNWSEIDDAWGKGMKRLEDHTRESLTRMKNMLEGYGERLGGALGGDKKEGGGTKPAFPSPGPGRGATTAIATDEITTKQKVDQIMLQMERDKLDAMVQMGLVSEQEKYAMQLEFENRSYQIDLRALRRQLQLDGLDLAQKRKLYNQIEVLKARHEQQMQRINLQSANAQAQVYRRIFQSINTAFRGSLQGVLQGTQTVGQAMRSLATNVLASFAEMLAEQALLWLENKILGIATATATGLGNIQSSAASGAAAAYASTAAIPVVGPALAPAAAMKAFADISAFTALLPSFDVGAYNLPSDTIARVHKGETILPARAAESFRSAIEGRSSMGGSGGGNQPIQINIHAVDSQSVARLFKNNSSALAAALKQAQRSNNKTLINTMKNA